jgi:hypothetical protein
MMGRRQRTTCEEDEWLNKWWRRQVYTGTRGKGRYLKRQMNKRYRREALCVVADAVDLWWYGTLLAP